MMHEQRWLPHTLKYIRLITLVPVYDVNVFGLLILLERKIYVFCIHMSTNKNRDHGFQTTSNLWYSFITNILHVILLTVRIVPIIYVTQIVWGHIPDACCQMNALPIP